VKTQTCTKCGEKKKLTEYYSRTRGGLREQCKACMRVMNLAYKSRNREQRKEKQRKYYLENRDKAKEYSRQYRLSESGLEVRKRAQDKYRQKPGNRELLRTKSRERYHRRLDSMCGEEKIEYLANNARKCRQYRIENPEKVRAANNIHHRRRKAAKTDNHTIGELHAYWRVNGIDPKRCTYCDAWHTKWTNNWKSSAGDHVLPLAHGGTDCVENIVPCCWTCNSAKSSYLLYEEWIPPKEQIAA